MINRKYDIAVGPQLTCTVEEAVARLLGWMQPERRNEAIQRAKDGVPSAHVPYVMSIQHPSSFLRDVKSNALAEHFTAINANVKAELLDELKQTILDLDAEAAEAQRFDAAIREELRKKEESALRVDFFGSERERRQCIYFTSLDRWAKEKYNSSVFESPEGKPSGHASQNRDGHLTAEFNPKDGETLQIDGWTTVKADDVLTFIAFLIEEYCKVGPENLTKAERTNASAIGRHFEKLATAANNKNELYGLDAETIRKLVAKARNTKIKKLKGE